jgi:FMRFamide related peptide family
MKLILFLIVVTFKHSRTAPTDSNSNKNNSDDWKTAGQSSSNVAYVSDTDELGNPGVILQFHRSIKNDNTDIEARQRSALDRSGRGFMRFGRTPNTVRFGRSSPDVAHYENDNNDAERDSNEPFSMKMRRSNMMRFGRGNMMRFGRGFNNPDNFFNDDYENDASEVYDLIDPPVGRSADGKYDEHGKKILRLGRSSSETVSDESVDIDRHMSKKATNDKNLMRFGRGNLMRFGRGNMMRFGRGNMMRFGRSEKNIVRFGKRSGGPKTLTTSAKIYCEDDNCLIQEKENQLLNNDDNNNYNYNNINNVDDELKKDQLNSLFGDESKQQGFGEYVLAK